MALLRAELNELYEKGSAARAEVAAARAELHAQGAAAQAQALAASKREAAITAQAE